VERAEQLLPFCFDDRPTADPQGLSVRQCLSDPGPRFRENPAEGRPRHAHLLGSGLMIKAFEVRKAKRFEPVEVEPDHSQLPHRRSRGLENPYLEVKIDAAGNCWSSHETSICS
jgi:hypothetical protein